MQNPNKADFNKLLHVLKYLNGTKDKHLILSADKDMKIKAYVDASWGTHVDGKSHTGIYVTIGTGPIICKSVKQRSVALSSTESELIGLTDSYPSISWLRSFLIHQGYKMDHATIYQDNNGVLELIKNGSGISSNTRHFPIKYFAITEKINNNEIKLVKCDTLDMYADILTKPLQGALFRKLRELTMTGNNYTN